MQNLTPHSLRIVVIDYFLGLHFRAFIETGCDAGEVLFSLNDVTDASKVDFVSATGGVRSDDGRKGVLIYMRWTEAPGMDDVVTMTVWQRGAGRYAEPEKLPDDGFDADRPTALLKGAALH
jgi:hypothetical protein